MLVVQSEYRINRGGTTHGSCKKRARRPRHAEPPPWCRSGLDLQAGVFRPGFDNAGPGFRPGFSGRPEDPPSVLRVVGHYGVLTPFSRTVRGFVLASATFLAAPAAAQSPSAHNQGALTFTGGLDVPSIYYFRGFRQERDPKVTLWPFMDLGITFRSGQGLFDRVGVNVGTWNSLQTGSSGLEGPAKGLHYEEDFYATLALGLGSGMGLGVTYTAYTSPNNMATTIKEASVKLARSGWLRPYGLAAFELNDKGQADSGSSKGTYVEFGASPSLTWKRLTFSAPLRVGLSAKDYYEGRDGDERFGFFDAGGLITMPIGVPERFGSWNVHGGGSYLRLGKTTESRNIDQRGNISNRAIVGIFGVGVAY